MTIKKRMFISNILMIFFPAILTGIIVLSVRLFTADNTDGGPPGHLIVIILALLSIMTLANWIFTKRISKSIISSIDTLVNGVNEISSGNLSHRIDYDADDEFHVVCAEFNKMADYLSNMVNQRQADENNRKELIAGISHDLRSPLTSIKAYVEGIKKGVASTPEMQEKYLDIIQSKTEDIEYIIKQLFLFSKMDIGEFPLNIETVAIEDELNKIFSIVNEEYKEQGLEISLTTEREQNFVAIDTVQFKNVVENILGNSVKYSGNDNTQVDIICNKVGHHVTIIIRDNGIGIPEKMLTQIFDLFYRSDASRSNPSKGSGLGLAISSKIIERFNGSINAQNVPTGGLEIIITLPILKVGN